ncbi:MAG: RNA polymerase sigma factor, partial [Gemmataceae bacterium]
MLEQARASDPIAWEKLVYLYTPLIHLWIRRSRLQEADNEDLVQEVFRAVNRGLAGFNRQQGGSFRSWLRTFTT